VAEHDKNGVSRRTFLFELAAVGLSTGALSACASVMSRVGASNSWADQIGLQLYTVRDLLEKDFEGTLEQIAQVGYKNMEFAGYYNRTPEQVRAILDRLKLASPSSHIGGPLMQRDAAAQIKIAQTIGQKYITLPSYNFGRDSGADGFKRGAAEFNKWGQMCKDAGLRLAYHNHAAEFAKVDGGPTGYDVLMRETDPALVDFELDLYWTVFADQDPLALFAKYPGRFTMWHVKDMQRDAEGKKAMAPVGRGTIDFKTMFANAGKSGLRYFFVEHDNAATTGGSMASVQASYTHLHQLLG
jgi:sugar phosphate isomerase/epimerase